jgi:Tfp pilus assembly protein PilN
MMPERQKIKPMNPFTAWGLLGLVLFGIWLGGYQTVAQYASQQKDYLSQVQILVQNQQSLIARASLIEEALIKAKLNRQKIKSLIDLKKGNPIPVFQSLIRKLAKDNGIQLTKIQIPKISKESHLQMLSIKVEGIASIENVRDFLKKTAVLTPLIRIDSLDLISFSRDTNNTRLNISLKASALTGHKR